MPNLDSVLREHAERWKRNADDVPDLTEALETLHTSSLRARPRRGWSPMLAAAAVVLVVASIAVVTEVLRRGDDATTPAASTDGRCRTEQFAVQPPGTDPATGGVEIVLRYRGSSRCSLRAGAPSVDIIDQQNHVERRLVPSDLDSPSSVMQVYPGDEVTTSVSNYGKCVPRIRASASTASLRVYLPAQSRIQGLAVPLLRPGLGLCTRVSPLEVRQAASPVRAGTGLVTGTSHTVGGPNRAQPHPQPQIVFAFRSRSVDAQPVAQRRTDPVGRYTLRLPVGRYYLFGSSSLSVLRNGHTGRCGADAAITVRSASTSTADVICTLY